MTAGAFGERPPFRVRRVEVRRDQDGREYRVLHCSSGFWNGPCLPGDKGFYKVSEFEVDTRFPTNSVSKNVSFWSDLEKHL